MKIKCRKIVSYEMERYPERCSECPAFKQKPYTCHNERGTEASCELGYMNGKDMRDFYGNVKYHGCGIENEQRVTITDFN